MAKFGKDIKDQSGTYDPFTAVGESLKGLREPPSSAEVSTPRPKPKPERPTPPPPSDSKVSFPVTKRLKTTAEDAAAADAAAVRLGAEMGVAVDFSKITRALWEVYLRHEEDILRNVPKGELIARPSNQDRVELATLDQRLSDVISEGLIVASRRTTST